MHKISLRLLIVASSAFLLSALLSCSVERKIAMEYISNDTIRSVMVIMPDYLYKTSLKDYQFEGADSLDDYQLDSLLYETSLFLRDVDDSIFLAGYYNSFCYQLERLGFTVYGEDSMLAFLSGKPGAYIVELAQVEIEEYVMPVVEKQQFDDYLYYQVIDLNAVNLNSWIELSRMNQEEEKQLFFSSIYITDAVDGYFRYNYFTGDVSYDYEKDSLILQEIYGLGEVAGEMYAEYTFDYLINMHLNKELESRGLPPSQTYYHYDRKRRWLLPAEEGRRFEPMEQ